MLGDFIHVTRQQLEAFSDAINQCTDAFVFVFDLRADELYMAEQAQAIFNFPERRFSHAKETLLRLVSNEDINSTAQELDRVCLGHSDTFNMECRLVNKNGKPVWVSMRGIVLRLGEKGEPTLLGRIAIIDGGDKFDTLTNLPTVSQLRKDFGKVWTRNQKVSGFILKVDVDNLGQINEQFGTHTGDFVLSLVSDCIKRSAKGIAGVYKLNSDEFICMNLTGFSAIDAQRIYQNLKRIIADTEQRIDYEVVFTVSMGTVAFYNDSAHLDELLKKVNYTITKAKKKGRNNLTLFNAVEYAKHLRNLDLQSKLRESIKNNFQGFQLFYQPVVDAKNLYLDKDRSVFNIIGAEALLRWSCPEYGMISPEEFVPILESSGLIIPVGRWILLTGFNQCREFNKVQKNFHMSLNLSYIQVKKSDVLSDVQIAIEHSGVNPENITLELTESGYMDNTAELQKLVNNFREMGIKVDIDDFGTGYSNLRYLQYLHAATLKLDYSFVHKATGGDEGDRKVIKHITQMAHELGMAVCMEGVETAEDIEKLEIYNPDKYQGFYFGRPCPVIQFREHYLRPDSKMDTYKK